MWRIRAQFGVEFSRDRDPHNICPGDPRQGFVGGGGVRTDEGRLH